MKTCGERIAELREKRGLTQEDLAAKLGFSRASLSHYEKSRREPDFSILDKLANFFHVSVDYILGRTDDPAPANQSALEFAEDLELSDSEILKKFHLSVDGRELTPEEAKRFIAFIRAERSMNSL